MNDQLASRYDTFIALYREQVVAVFRYHLLRCGDWQEAESWTQETFQRAWRWFRRQAHEPDQKVWLFRIAVSAHAGIRRAPAEPSAQEIPITPSQEQLRIYARVADVHEAWRRQGRKRFDAFALHLFAGLDVEETGLVVGWDPVQTQERLARLVSDNQELRLLAKDLEPVGYFVQRLEREIQQFAGQPPRRGSLVAGPRAWWWRYRLGPALTILGQLLTVLVLAGLFLWGVGFFRSTDASDAVPGDAQATVSRLNLRQQSSNDPPPADLPDSQDRVLLVSEAGAIVVLDLADGSTRQVTPDGFIPTGPLDPRYPPHITPDGAWLVLVRPGGTTTFLFSLLGDGRDEISSAAVRPFWAPSGGEAVYVLPEDHHVLYQYSAAPVHNRELARLPGEVRWAAWSPDGRLIGVVYTNPGPQSSQQTTTLAVLDSLGSQRIVLASVVEDVSVEQEGLTINLHRLMWTEDSSELWYPRWRVAFPIDPSLAVEPAAGLPNPSTGQFLAVQPRILAQQAFSDLYGLQSLLLYDRPADYEMQVRNTAISPDRNRVALTLRNPDGSWGTLAVRFSTGTNNLWIANFGQVERVSWTQEGGNLIVAQNADRPGAVYRVNAENGARATLAEHARLLGTFSELLSRGRGLAPQTLKIPTNGADFSGPRVEVTQAGMDMRLAVPAHWQVWLGSEIGPYRSMVISNVSFGDPIGLTSLAPDDIVISVYQTYPYDEAEYQSFSGQMQTDSGVRSIEKIEVGGREAYRFRWKTPGSAESGMVMVNGVDHAYVIGYAPADSTRIPVLDEMLASIRFDDALATPEAQDDGESDWYTYVYYDLGIEFQLPMGLYPGDACGVRDGDDGLQIGSRIFVSESPSAGASLREYVETLTAQNADNWAISLLAEGETHGLHSIQVAGSQDVNGYFSMTFIERGEEILLVSYSPMGVCRFAAPDVSELQIYQRIVESIQEIAP